MFTPGRSYNRRSDLHARFGGQRQGGISTPADHPLIFIFTGEQGERYGYEDGFQDDDVYWYTGEGQVGDMEMKGGNRALRDHVSNGKTVHLFTYEGQPSGQVEYVGEVTYLDHHREPGKDREGTPRQAIVFEFEIESKQTGEPARSVQEDDRKRDGLSGKSLAELRRIAIESGVGEGGSSEERKQRVYKRSQAVKRYVLRRADGVCEGCGVDAPFLRPSGDPYLEPHHVTRRADGGPDHPANVVALCPTCHRRVHQGANGTEYNRELAERAQHMESPLERGAEALG